MESNTYRVVVVVRANLYNTLWLVRALGMAGFKLTVIIIGEKNGISRSVVPSFESTWSRERRLAA